MSRCYSYPPPGYEKKAYVELGFSPKKEKHKQKDKGKEKEKKKKKRKDGETNGDASHDADKRSKKAHERGVIKEGLSLQNGRTRVISSEAVDEKHSRTVPMADHRLSSSVLSGGVLSINGKGLEGEESKLPLVSIKAASSSRNGEAAKAETESSSSKAPLKFEPELSRLYHFVPLVEKVWCGVDDQEWLFPPDVQAVPKVKKSEARDTARAWAEAAYLPSVGIYALPYVVPD